MAVLDILTIPNPKLKTKAVPVIDFNEQLEQLVEDLFETMYAAPGIGLAATQVDIHQQVVVMDISEEKDSPRIFINPKIIEQQGEQIYEEGCLSVPGIYAKVKRANQIKVHYQNLKGVHQELEADGLLAVCIQHEIDHLKGVVFLDHLSLLKRKIALKKLGVV